MVDYKGNNKIPNLLRISHFCDFLGANDLKSGMQFTLSRRTESHCDGNLELRIITMVLILPWGNTLLEKVIDWISELLKRIENRRENFRVKKYILAIN